MNDKIGNYIHWNFDNYRKYGLGTKETGHKGGSWSEALNAQRNAMIAFARQGKSQGSKEAIRQELMYKLNFFFATQNTVRNGEVYTQAELETMQQQIAQIVQNAIGHGTVNLATLTATDDDKLGILTDPLRALKDTNEGWNWYDAIKRRIDLMCAKRDELANLINSSKGGAQWQSDLSALMAEFESIQAAVQARLGAGTNLAGHQVTAADWANSKTTREKFVGEINRLIGQAKKGANAQLTGEVGEMYATISMAALQKKTKGEVQKLLKDLLNGVTSLESLGLAGKNSSTAVKVTSNFALQGLDQESRSNMGEIFQKFGSNIIRISPTQDKVDVEITLDNNSTLNASIKNYDLSSGGRKIHILNGSDILNYIQEYANFVNHYLNMTAIGDTTISARNGSLVKAANEIMALTLAVKALMGGVEKMDANGNHGLSDTAEVFIVHDSSQVLGGWSIYFMSDIIDKLVSVGERIFNYVDIDGFSLGTTWPMNWVYSSRGLNYSDAYKRIIQLLMDLSAFKISISIDQKALA